MGQTAEAQRRKGRSVTLARDWRWEAYEQEARMPPGRLQVARACFTSIEEAVGKRSLTWLPRFHSWYVGFYRSGDYNTVSIDLRTRVPLVAVKLPDPPELLALTSPYPDLAQNWDAVHHQWGWLIPSGEAVPDFGEAIDLSRPYQPESGPMRPPTADAPETH
jgi:hypothetical protein